MAGLSPHPCSWGRRSGCPSFASTWYAFLQAGLQKFRFAVCCDCHGTAVHTAARATLRFRPLPGAAMRGEFLWPWQQGEAHRRPIRWPLSLLDAQGVTSTGAVFSHRRRLRPCVLWARVEIVLVRAGGGGLRTVFGGCGSWFLSPCAGRVTREGISGFVACLPLCVARPTAESLIPFERAPSVRERVCSRLLCHRPFFVS